MRKTVALVIGCLVALPTLAQAAPERKSPLAGSPAIRKRVELRSKRFELGAGVATTLGQDFYHAAFVNLRAGVHIADWLGISATAGVFNLTPDMKTSFHSQLADSVSTSGRYSPGNPAAANPAVHCANERDDNVRQCSSDKTPTAEDTAGAANRISMVIAPQIDIVPFTGKFALFSKLFMNYDLYLFGGPGLVNLVKKGDVDLKYCGPAVPTANDPHPAPRCEAYTGMKVGANVGVGMHAFINHYFAINLELRDLIFKNNAAGRDVNGDGVTDSHDLLWTYHNWMIGLNATFFLPATAKISN